ncbi:Mediator of RNA polymerase II transcription subunit 15a, partial [Striga hermonthica]
METLKRHLPFSGQEGQQELEKIAVTFEEKNYTAATSQQDYLRKISLKMLTMETKFQNPKANSLQSNASSNSKAPQDRVTNTSMLTVTTHDRGEATAEYLQWYGQVSHPTVLGENLPDENEVPTRANTDY